MIPDNLVEILEGMTELHRESTKIERDLTIAVRALQDEQRIQRERIEIIEAELGRLPKEH